MQTKLESGNRVPDLCDVSRHGLSTLRCFVHILSLVEDITGACCFRFESSTSPAESSELPSSKSA